MSSALAKIKARASSRRAFTLPDGEVLTLKPVKAMEALVKAGMQPAGIKHLLTRTKPAAAEDFQDEQTNAEQLERLLDKEGGLDVLLNSEKLNDAYLVLGIAGPFSLVWDDVPTLSDNQVYVSDFRAEYGAEVCDEIRERVLELSGTVKATEIARDPFQGDAVAVSPTG